MYLEFLGKSNGGQRRYRATGIRSVEDQYIPVENALWNKYQCELPKHLTLRPDSSATVIVQADPGNETEIRIIDYERRTGLTNFISKRHIEGHSGDVIIDFRWLVRRCVEWYQQNGVSIKSIEDVHAITSNVSIPELKKENKLSQAQKEAIQGIFTSSLSYVWGPPGTGKTRWVLAKAARHCFNMNERILVLASTNLAVDNALSALLDDEGIPEEKVARIGIPSDIFVKNHPSCCEERALQNEINQIRLSLKEVSDSIAIIEKGQTLRTHIQAWKDKLDISTREQSELSARLAAVQKRIYEYQNIVSNHRNTLQQLVSEHDAKRRELEEVAFPQLIADIETLEHDQTSTIRETTELDNKLSMIGFLAKVFTGRKRELTLRISALEEHLRSVETTLESRRITRDKVQPFVAELSADISRLAVECARIGDLIESQVSEISNLEQERTSLQAMISQCKETVLDMENRIRDAAHEISSANELYPLEQATKLLENMYAEKNQLESRLLQFRQDLASKMVLGMTLDGFIGLTLGTNLDVDRVFIDEAPYAPIAKVLPIMSLGCPIALLGDHCQLPPVCECENNEAIRAYWAKSAIFLEDAWRLGQNWQELNSLEKPNIVLFQRYDLKESYRYGESLASLLDHHIYFNLGLVGLMKEDTSIECIDCRPIEKPNRERRENDSEVSAIMNYLGAWWQWAQEQPVLPSIAVLTPYKKQKSLISKRLSERYGNSEINDVVEVWNTHQAQGREWDWVLFSVSDTGNLKFGVPFFTDTKTFIGRAVLNTTISRTKRHLAVFLDMEYWKHRPSNSLLTDLVRQRT